MREIPPDATCGSCRFAFGPVGDLACYGAPPLPEVGRPFVDDVEPACATWQPRITCMHGKGVSEDCKKCPENQRVFVGRGT